MEREKGIYFLSAYYLSKSVSSLPSRIFFPFLYFTLSYFLAFKVIYPTCYLFLLLILILSGLTGESIGQLLGVITLRYDFAFSLATMVAIGMFLLGGFYVRTLPPFLTWLRFTSVFRYAFDAVVQLQFIYGPTLGFV